MSNVVTKLSQRSDAPASGLSELRDTPAGGPGWDAYAPGGHGVHFYEDDSFLLDGLSRFVGGAIAGGDCALVVATPAHCEGLRQRLAKEGLDLSIAERQGRFIAEDAAATLGKFMAEGHPDRARFEAVVGGLVQRLATENGGRRRVAVFGEMVALLWAEGNQRGAIELEQLWNRLAEKQPFALHCAYPMRLFPGAGDEAGMREICAEHSHVAPAEQYSALRSDEARLSAIALLQQKAQADLKKRENELREFLENAVVAMHWVANDGTILWANQSELKLLGYSAEEYIGHHISEFHADKEVIDDILERLQRREELHGREARMRRKDGSIRYVRLHSNVFSEDGKFCHTRCFTIDVTETHRSERRVATQYAITQLLSESATLTEAAGPILEAICDSSECDLAAVWLAEGDKIRCVTTWHRSKTQFPEFEKLTARSEFWRGEGLPGRIWATNQPAWIEDVGQDNNLPRLATAMREGIRSAIGFPITTQRGAVGAIEFFSGEERQRDDEFMTMMAALGNQIGQFIERKRAERALHESEHLLRIVTDASPVMVWMSGTDKLCYYFNKAWLEFVGRTLEQESGHGWAENVHPDDFNRCLESYVSSFEARRPFEMEYRLRHHSGQYRWILDHGVPRFSADGTFEGFVGGCLDIHDKKEAREAERKLAAIVESSDDAIASKDLNGIVTSWNQAAERLFGYKAEEIIGKTILTIIPPELHGDEEMILGKIRRGERIEHFETVRIAKNGERIEVSLTISPVKDNNGQVIGAAKIVRNITENKKIERALRTTEKLAAAGRLAATVAHEINNPLEAVTNLVYLAKRDLPENARAGAHLKLAQRELERVAHIARQTLGFYRDTSSPARFNLARAMDDLLSLYEKRFEGRNIRVVKEYEPEIEITALAGEVRQALSNIITNAIDAMPEGGTLTIRVTPTHEPGNSAQAGVRITIMDTGSGIAPQHRKSLFQPFFTTKDDVGTGLGLWITRNIVQKHRGSIQVKSRTGAERHGTAFSIFLPQEAKLDVASAARPGGNFGSIRASTR
jgi:PAS domain S-box-containing protein